MVGTSNRSDGGRPLVVGMVVAACMGGLYVGLTSLFGIRPGLLAGTILAIAVGATVSCFSSSDNFVPSGAGAAAITLIALMASRPLWSSQQRAAVLEDSCSDESCIHALAETAMWRIAQDSDSEGGGGKYRNLELAMPGADLLTGQGKIPDSILQQATRQWSALPETEKEKMRKTRKRLVARSHGENLERYGEPSGWGNLLATGILSVLIAFLVGASAAVRGSR